jgi:hypothetical protein
MQVNSSRKRKKRRRKEVAMPIAEEKIFDICKTYPAVKKMLETFNLAVS